MNYFFKKKKDCLNFVREWNPLNINWIVQLHVNSVDEETIKKNEKVRVVIL